jgi:hypothetical protein
MTQATTRYRSAVAAHPVISAAIAILVAADIFFSLYTPIYARLTPKLGDFPFFYWYLLIFMPITSLALWLASLLQQRLAGDVSTGDVRTVNLSTGDTGTGGAGGREDAR